MKEANLKIDTSKLMRKADVDELKEAYETIHRDGCYRIGAGVRLDNSEQIIFFLEGVVPLCGEEGEVKLDELRSKLKVLETFESFGYTLRCEKDNSVICEKKVLESQLEEEYERLEEILQNLK